MCKTGASMSTEAAPGLSGWIDGMKEGERGGRWREIKEGEGRTTNKCLPRKKKNVKILRNQGMPERKNPEEQETWIHHQSPWTRNGSTHLLE